MGLEDALTIGGISVIEHRAQAVVVPLDWMTTFGTPDRDHGLGFVVFLRFTSRMRGLEDGVFLAVFDDENVARMDALGVDLLPILVLVHVVRSGGHHPV